MAEVTVARGSTANPQNAISRRTMAYGGGHARTAVNNRAADLVRRYANGSSEQSLQNFGRIQRAYNNMTNRL